MEGCSRSDLEIYNPRGHHLSGILKLEDPRHAEIETHVLCENHEGIVLSNYLGVRFPVEFDRFPLEEFLEMGVILRFQEAEGFVRDQ